LMAGTRFLVAGTALPVLARLRGAALPSRREWVNAALTGVLLLGVGNGGVTWAEQTVPSGIAALVASAIPVWMVLLDWARRSGVQRGGRGRRHGLGAPGPRGRGGRVGRGEPRAPARLGAHVVRRPDDARRGRAAGRGAARRRGRRVPARVGHDAVPARVGVP